MNNFWHVVIIGGICWWAASLLFAALHHVVKTQPVIVQPAPFDAVGEARKIVWSYVRETIA